MAKTTATRMSDSIKNNNGNAKVIAIATMTQHLQNNSAAMTIVMTRHGWQHWQWQCLCDGAVATAATMRRMPRWQPKRKWSDKSDSNATMMIQQRQWWQWWLQQWGQQQLNHLLFAVAVALPTNWNATAATLLPSNLCCCPKVDCCRKFLLLVAVAIVVPTTGIHAAGIISCCCVELGCHASGPSRYEIGMTTLSDVALDLKLLSKNFQWVSWAPMQWQGSNKWQQSKAPEAMVRGRCCGSSRNHAGMGSGGVATVYW